MPLYRTGPDLSLEDLVAAIESRGEKIEAWDCDNGQWTVATSLPKIRSLTTNLDETETRSA